MEASIRGAIALVIAAAFLAPVVSAEGGIEGSLNRIVGIDVHGNVAMTGSEGILDLSALARRPDTTPAMLTFESAEGHVTKRYRSEAWAGVDKLQLNREYGQDNYTFSAGSLSGFACEAICDFILVGEGAEGEFRIGGAIDGAFGPVDTPRVHYGGMGKPEAANSFHRLIDKGWIGIDSGAWPNTTIRVEDATATARGNLQLFVWNATVVVASEGSTTEIRTGILARDPVDVNGQWVVDDVTSGFLILNLTGASLSLGPKDPFRFSTQEATVGLTGIMNADEADGRMAYDGQTMPVDRQSLVIGGDLSLSISSVPTRNAFMPTLRDKENPWQMGIAGTATTVVIGDVGVSEAQVAARTPIIEWTMGAAALSIGIYGLWRLLLVPLYSRIERSRILHNPNRRRIYNLVDARPGVTVSELARETGLARVVVQHHVQKLEDHRFLTGRATGKIRGLFVPTAMPPSPDRWGALMDPTRRSVADALESRGEATQRDLVEALGISQRLVSYHLTRLAAAGVVDVEPGMPRKYRLADAVGQVRGSVRAGEEGLRP